MNTPIDRGGIKAILEGYRKDKTCPNYLPYPREIFPREGIIFLDSFLLTHYAETQNFASFTLDPDSADYWSPLDEKKRFKFIDPEIDVNMPLSLVTRDGRIFLNGCLTDKNLEEYVKELPKILQDCNRIFIGEKVQ